MISTIKFNSSILPNYLKKLFPSENDIRDLINSNNFTREEFSNYVSSIYNGKKIFKSTKPLRHKLSNQIFLKEIENNYSPVIIDIGASDGSTSLDLIELLEDKFSKYYVTDISFNVDVLEKNNNTYFYDSKTGECLIIVNNYFVIFKDELVGINPIKIIANYLISKAPAFNSNEIIKLNLCQPDLVRSSKNDPRIVLEEWDIFKKWTWEKADFIKAANILNRNFFSNESLELALNNIKCAIKVGGKLLVIENRRFEKWSLFKNEEKKFVEIQSFNGGSEIRDLVLKNNIII